VLLSALDHLGPGRRFGAKAPRHQRGAGRAGPCCQGPLPTDAAQCPAPMAAWVTTGAAADTHSSVPEGLVPSRARRASCSCNRALVLSRAIPVLSPRRRECAKAPGLPPPGRCRPAGAGCAGTQGPAASALALVAHLLRRHLLAGLRARVTSRSPVRKYPHRRLKPGPSTWRPTSSRLVWRPLATGRWLRLGPARRSSPRSDFVGSGRMSIHTPWSRRPAAAIPGDRGEHLFAYPSRS
jgi:hypothetical protein